MRRIAASVVVTLAVPLAHAEFTSIRDLTAGELESVTADLGAAFSYKGVTPATSLGTTGFDLGLVVSDTRIENPGLFRRAGAGAPSHVTVPKLHLHKGLPWGIDVGAFVAAASEVDARLFGADIRYALVRDGLASPAVAVRLSGTRATGLGDLRLATAAADLLVSKKFAVLTPYAGAGFVRTTARAANSDHGEARAEEARMFVGINVNLVAVNLALEAEKAGDNRTFSAKLGWRF